MLTAPLKSHGGMAMKTIIEPFKIKMVEALQMTTREEREQIIKEKDYNPFLIRSKHVLIDLQIGRAHV